MFLKRLSWESRPENITNATRNRLLVYIVIGLLTCFAFEEVRNHNFITYDDPIYVTNNVNIRNGLSKESIVWSLTAECGANWHPLTVLSHIVDCELFGLNPGAHHLVNLLYHVLNTLLLFYIFHKMTGAFWRSIFVAVIFAIHPLRVESVAWISERKDVLSTFLVLLTILAYIKYAEKPTIAKHLLVISFFALSLTAKPMAVTLPFLLLLLDFWPLKRIKPGRKNDKRETAAKPVLKKVPLMQLLIEKIPLFILAILSGVITYLYQKDAGTITRWDLMPRLANSLYSYLFYLIKFFVPYKLAPYYPYPVEGIPIWKIGTAFLVIAGITAFVIYHASNYRYLFVGWFWYIGTLVPVIGIVQVCSQAAADRYAYWPLIGIQLILAWGINDITLKWKYRKVILTAAALLLTVILTILCRVQVSRWKNSLTLYQHALKVTEKNYFIHHQSGLALKEAGKFDEAIRHYKEALRISPAHMVARRQLCELLYELKEYDQIIWVLKDGSYDKKDLPEVYRKLGYACHKKEDFEESIRYFKKAIELGDNNEDVYFTLASIFEKQQKNPEALDYYRKVIELNPSHHQAHYYAGNLLAGGEYYRKAIYHYKEAIKYKPDHIDAIINLGNCLAMEMQYDSACEYYKKALLLDPNNQDANDNLSKISKQLTDTQNSKGH